MGLTAVELGKLMGARVIAAASTAEKLALCKEYGADEVINYTEEDLKARVKALTDGCGADVVYDPVGGDYSEAALRATAWKGRFLVVGFAAGEIPKVPLNLALLKGCAIVGVFWGKFATSEASKSMGNTMQLVQWHMQGKIRPHIDRVYALEEAPQALRDLMERRVRGKAVIRPRGLGAHFGGDLVAALQQRVRRDLLPSVGLAIFRVARDLRAGERQLTAGVEVGGGQVGLL